MNQKKFIIPSDSAIQETQSREAAFPEMAEELEKTRSELNMLTRAVAGGVARLALDDHFRIITATEGYYRMTGYTKEELELPPFCGRGINIVLPQDQPAIQEALETLLAGNEPLHVSYRIRRKNGSIAWNTAYCAQAEWRGTERTIDVFFRDITEHRQAEIEFESLLNHLPVGVVRVSIGEQVKIQYANAELYRQIGYSAEEIAGAPFCNDYLSIVKKSDRKKLLEWSKTCSESTREYPAVDYRIVTKSGEIRWMRATTSRINDLLEPQPVMQGIIADITEERNQRRAVAHNEERFRIISEQTRDTVFDWDISKDTIQFSPAYEKMFGFAPPDYVPIKSLTQYDIIYEDDKPQVEAMIQEILGGAPYAETQYRAKCADGSYIWCRNRVTTLYDDDHQPIRAIGILTDIDSYMRKTSTLQEQAMRDSLTGLLNRMSFQEQAEALMREYPDRLHAFLLFDADHFKQLNDTMGHLSGDQTLRYLAHLLTLQFRESDLGGRMGGDEFAVFLSNIPSERIAGQRAERLLAAVRRHAGSASFEKACPFTISIGTAVYPQDGRTFPELYKHADQALYRAKKKGGDTWA